MPESQQIETRSGVSYATHDGVSLLGDLYLPAGAGPFPALVARCPAPGLSLYLHESASELAGFE